MGIVKEGGAGIDGCIREAVVHADEKEERHSQQNIRQD